MAGGANAVGIAVVNREEGVVTAGQSRGDPRCGGVAGSAGGGPSSRGVVGIRGPGEVRRMAGVAICWRSGKDVIDMAEIAGHSGVRTGQREWGAVVVESRARPIRRGVAGVASGGEAGRGVIWIRGSIPVSLVAAVAESR